MVLRNSSSHRCRATPQALTTIAATTEVAHYCRLTHPTPERTPAWPNNPPPLHPDPPHPTHISRPDHRQSQSTPKTCSTICRGSTFPLLFSEWRSSKIAGIPNLASKNGVFVCLAHGIIHRHVNSFLLKSVFRWGVEPLKWGASEKIGWNLYRRTPPKSTENAVWTYVAVQNIPVPGTWCLLPRKDVLAIVDYNINFTHDASRARIGLAFFFSYSYTSIIVCLCHDTPCTCTSGTGIWIPVDTKNTWKDLVLTLLLILHSRCGDDWGQVLGVWVVGPKNGTTVLKGLRNVNSVSRLDAFFFWPRSSSIAYGFRVGPAV